MNKRYYFADKCIELISENPIETLEAFSPFVTDREADLTFVVREGRLPERKGEILFSDYRRTFLLYEGREYLFTSYFDAKSSTYIDYACRVRGDDGLFLYVDFDGGMWDSMIFDALGVPDLLIEDGAAVMHTSYVVCDGEAVLFTADKQVGKSTQAALWEKYMGALVVNSDRAAVKEKDGRLFACGVPYRGSSEVSLCVNTPVRAIVVLGQSKENTIRRLSPTEAFMNILGKFTYDTWREASLERAMEIAAYASENVPVYKLDCLPDESAVRCLNNELKF